MDYFIFLFPIMFPRQKSRHYQAGLLPIIEKNPIIEHLHKLFSPLPHVCSFETKESRQDKLWGKIYFNKETYISFCKTVSILFILAGTASSALLKRTKQN